MPDTAAFSGPFGEICGLAAGWRGITGQRAGTVTDAPGASGAVWPRSLRRSPPEQARLRENGETTFGAVDRGPVRANNGKPGRSRGRPPGTTSRPKRRPRDRWCDRTLCDGRHVCGKKQSRQEPLGSCTASWLRIIMLNPSAHGGCKSAGSPDSTSSRTASDFDYTFLKLYSTGAGNHSEMDLKTIALDSTPAVAERKEFNRGYTPTGCVGSRPPQTLEKNIERIPLGRWMVWLLGGPE